jgi:predicted RNA binding protein YcfA (HicA-like mRNA interferase family)
MAEGRPQARRDWASEGCKAPRRLGVRASPPAPLHRHARAPAPPHHTTPPGRTERVRGQTPRRRDGLETRGLAGTSAGTGTPAATIRYAAKCAPKECGERCDHPKDFLPHPSMSTITRRALTAWLLDHGFTELGGKATSHRRFRHESGVVITVPGHGRQNLSQKHVGMIMRQLEASGFDRDTVRRDLNAR